MRQAIITKYHGYTDTKGPRISATSSAGRIYVDWNDRLDAGQNHTAAAMAFAKKLGWHGVWHAGGLPDGTGNVYVLVDATEPEVRT